MFSKKSIIIFTVFVDVLGLSIVIPTLPYYVQSFGASPFVITLLFSVFALFSFFSAPLLGTLSDRIGRRPVLLISIASTAIGWIIFALAGNLFFLFLGRIIDGLAAGNFSTAQSYLVDISKDDKERTANLGVIGAIFGLAFIIGPLFGGLLSSISIHFPFWTVAFLATFNLILAYFNLPETHHRRDLTKKIELNPLAPIARAFRNPKLLPGFIAFFLFGIAVAGQQSIFTLYLDKIFHYGSFTAGLFMTGVGVVISLNQGLLLKRFWLKYFKEKNLELIMLLVFAVGFFLLSTSLLGIFIIGVVLITFGQSVLRVVMTSQMVASGGQSHGEVLGVLTSVMSVSMIIGPMGAGWLFGYFPHLPFIISGFIILIVFALSCYNYRKLTKFSKPEEAHIEVVA